MRTDIGLPTGPAWISLPFAVYLARGIEPDLRTLPWQEDIKETPARPVSDS
jgi:hypothetical protein